MNHNRLMRRGQDSNLRSPLRSGRLKAEVPRTSWVSAPLRSVQAEVPRTSWTLCARTMCPNQLEVVSLNSCKNKNTPSHMCEGVFLVVATRFELATSASRTQRSTKLSHTSKYHCNIISHPSNLVKAFFSVLYPLCFFYCVDLWCMTNLLKSFSL